MHVVTTFIRGVLASPDLVAGTTGTSAPIIIRLLARPDTDDHQEDFTLPYNPIQVRYGGLSDEISQIPRPNRAPIVAFKSHKLMTLDFSFIAVHPGDGLLVPVDDEIMVLRRFASSSNRAIQLIGFDNITNTPTQFRNQDNVYSALLFTIVDFNVESIRRNMKNEITQATCTISLIENRNPQTTRVLIPPLKAQTTNKPCSKKKYRLSHPTQCIKTKTSGETGGVSGCQKATCFTMRDSAKYGQVGPLIPKPPIKIGGAQ